MDATKTSTRRGRSRAAPQQEISAAELCRRAGIHRTTLARYVDRGVVEVARTIEPSGQQLFRLSDVATVKRAAAEGRRRNGRGAA